jgi:dsDNA-specific endonuclease/ATPase MutS2
VVVARQALTAEAIELLAAGEEPQLAGIADVREAAELAARGGTLGPAALRAVARSVAVALAARAGLVTKCYKGLSELLAAVDPGLEALVAPIERAVEEDGSDLRDDASPELRRLRRELRSGRERIAAEIQRIARASGEHLQEQFVTERDGRPVLAV